MLNTITSKATKILLVDDHQSFMDGLSMVINTLQPEFEIIGLVTSAAELFNAVNSKEADLILLDIDLGDANGIELLPELVKKTKAKVLILTGIHDPELHEKAILHGAKGVLLKDEPAKVIIKAIQKVSEGEIWISNTILNKVFDHLTKSGKNSGFRDDEARKINDLTIREREIIKTLFQLETSTNEEIADYLHISPSTLKNHLTTIYSKLEVKNRVQLMKYALNNGLNK